MSTKKLALIAVLVSQAAVLHYIESLLPNPIPIPGVKLGLANIITLLALVMFDFKTALTVILMRTVLGSLLSGTLFGVGFLLSITGALTAGCVMALLFRFTPFFSFLGISVAGAVAHSIGQLTIASLIINQPGIFYYLPIMLLLSVPAGSITGLLLKELVQYLKSTDRFNM
ncbi:Gx transporter family protein [Desulfitobacterium sp. Sab5]|uniref:Gx transporter family protein n=1 Tax=Desulfitobacterium nosdiversum TaxID=3375356 RepID=UPI003CF12EE3